MVSAMTNVTGRLAEILLGEPLDQWVRKQRVRGHSWERISRDLHAATQIEMAGNTIRVRFPDPANAATG